MHSPAGSDSATNDGAVDEAPAAAAAGELRPPAPGEVAAPLVGEGAKGQAGGRRVADAGAGVTEAGEGASGVARA